MIVLFFPFIVNCFFLVLYFDLYILFICS